MINGFGILVCGIEFNSEENSYTERQGREQNHRRNSKGKGKNGREVEGENSEGTG